jgi:L-seryl-tRNA(Ser) seleniumtransferase
MNTLRQIPAVSALLNEKAAGEMAALFSRESTVNAIRSELTERRRDKRAGTTEEILSAVRQRLEKLNRTGMKSVVNGTGVLLHTNLGRAVLSGGVIEEIIRTMAGYVDLEMDLESGKRGCRAVHVEAKMNHLMGSEACLVVNNNAAALMLAINTFSLDREVVVSRGELIEIGGSFRLPDIISRAGGVLKEVGTTNKTKLSDYERAIGKKTGMVLKIHTSNYRIEGFTEEAALRDMAVLCRKKRVPLMHDAGSGLFVDPSVFSLENEPDPRKSLKEGASLVSMSGDKLLGGPQAGVLAGKKALIDDMKKNPLMRALRLGKLSLCALDAALIPFVNPGRIAEAPLFKQLAMDDHEIRARADHLMGKIRQSNPSVHVRVVPSKASVGGGAMPGSDLLSFAVLLNHPSLPPERIAEVFRLHTTPIIGMFFQGQFGLDVRALFEGDEAIIAECAGKLK